MRAQPRPHHATQPATISPAGLAAWRTQGETHALLDLRERGARRWAPPVMTCADGVASTLGVATLGRLGYRAVRVLAGGTGAWEAAGFPVERGKTRLLDEADDVVLKPYERGRKAMQDYLRWEELLDDQGRSPHPLPGAAR